MSKQFKPFKRPKQKRSLETFNSILKAGENILASEGIDAFNTNRIAEVAGVSISSLYQYFPNKESILGELIVEFISKQDSTILSELDQLPSDANLKDSLYSLISTLVDYNYANQKMCSIVYSNIETVGRMHDVSKIDQGSIELLEKVFKQFQEEVRSQNMDILLRIIFHSIRGVYTSIHYNLNPASFDSETLKNELAYLAYRYLT
jgi:AcrR family transcriptional regulator